MATARKFKRVISDAGAVATVDFSQLPPEYYGFAVSSPQPMYTASSTPGYGGMLANFTSENYALQNNSLGKEVRISHKMVENQTTFPDRNMLASIASDLPRKFKLVEELLSSESAVVISITFTENRSTNTDSNVQHTNYGETVSWNFLIDLERGESIYHRITEAQRDELNVLKNAAESKNRREFALIASSVEWLKYPPSELIKAIDLALALDMIEVARELTQKGRKLFRDNKRIQQAASVLSPPLFMRTEPVQVTTFELSQQWLTEHSARYRGLWVAVRAGMLLGSAATLKELYERIGSTGRTPETMIVKVLS